MLLRTRIIQESNDEGIWRTLRRRIMGEINLKMLKEQAIKEREAAIASVRDGNNASGFSVYINKYFSTTSDALEFLNTHHIDPNDIVSLIKHNEVASKYEYELIFFDHIKTEKYSVVDEKWIDGNPRLFKESEEVFSDKSVFMVDSKFKSLLSFPPMHKDEYKHVYVLRQELEWMSGNVKVTDISRSDNQSDQEESVPSEMAKKKSPKKSKSCSYPERY